MQLLMQLIETDIRRSPCEGQPSGCVVMLYSSGGLVPIESLPTGFLVILIKDAKL